MIKFNGTNILWAKVWDGGEDDCVGDVGKCENVYVAVTTSKNGVLLMLSDEGKLVWAKELKIENEDWSTSLTAVTCYKGYVFAGGDFLAKIDPNGETLWCRYPFGLITNIQAFGDHIYVLDDDRIYKFDVDGNLLWVKGVKDRSYVYLKSMHVNSD